LIIRKVKKIIKRIIYRIYYSYPSYQVYDFFQRLSGYKKEKQRFFKLLGYTPDIKNPNSFNEKVLWKKIYDRNPILPIITDKYKVREYLKYVLGKKEAEKILIPLLYVTDKPENISFDNLLEEYIIKPSHKSRKYIIAKKKAEQKKYTLVEGSKSIELFDSTETRNEIISICKEWLLTPHGFYRHEWAYQKINRKIVIEKLLNDATGKIPDDYLFYVFNGKCKMILVVYDRFSDKSRSYYTPEWEKIPIKGHIKEAGNYKRPEKLESMINLAEWLGKNFDFIRVDLYLLNNNIYFGELTSYPMSGTNPLNPVSYDYKIGENWQLCPGYWKKLCKY